MVILFFFFWCIFTDIYLHIFIYNHITYKYSIMSFCWFFFFLQLNRMLSLFIRAAIILHTGWLKWQNFMSQFWRLQVQNQVSAVLLSPVASLFACRWLPSSHVCLHMVLPLCIIPLVSLGVLISTYESDWIRAHSNSLILTLAPLYRPYLYIRFWDASG